VVREVPEEVEEAAVGEAGDVRVRRRMGCQAQPEQGVCLEEGRERKGA